MNRRVRTSLFWAALAVIVVANVVVSLQSLLVLHFWEDEAFNLTVPLNLLDGLGYTSDGALSGSTLTPFDPRISTGPSVLLPAAAVIGLGVDPLVGARLVPLLYWVLLLVGLWILGRRIAGRWAGLLAVAVPLAFDASALPSPIQGPADLLGEIPAAALLVWALVALPRRAWLAGLLVGLAVQAKLIALLALPAFAVALWALAPGSGWGRVAATLRRGWLPLVLAGVPTLAVELAAFLVLGPADFVEHLLNIARFVRSGGQDEAPTTVIDKLAWFADSWHLPAWAVLISGIAGVGLIVAALIRTRRIDRERLALLLAASVGILAFLGWWSTAAHTPLWVRHPSPGVLAFVPILAAFAVWAVQALWAARDESTTPRATSPSAVAIAASLAVALVTGGTAIGVVQHGVIGVSPPTVPTLQAQRDAVAELEPWAAEAQPEWLAADPWGSAVPIIVMLGAHVGLSDADAMRDVTRLGFACAVEPLAASAPYIICPAP